MIKNIYYNTRFYYYLINPTGSFKFPGKIYLLKIYNRGNHSAGITDIINKHRR